MHKSIHYKTFVLLIVGGLWFLSPLQVYAQPDLPQVQLVELSGIEPPPAGLEAQLNVGWGGGGLECQYINVNVIEASGFTPPIAPNGFGLYLDCIENVSTPFMLYFYERGEGDGRFVWRFLAVRSFYAASSHNALIQVKLSRSFPIDISRIGIIVSTGSPDPSDRNWGTGSFSLDYNSRCRASLPIDFTPREAVEVSRVGGINLMNAPDPSSGVIVNIPSGTHLTLSSMTQCGADGRTYWLIQHDNVMGWLPQGDLGANWLVSIDEARRRESLSACEGTLPSLVHIGQRARIAVIDGTPANVRMNPDGITPAFTVIPELTTFTVVSGPWCGTNNRGESVAFWLVRLDDGTKGWVIEVTPSIRVIEPIE